MPRLCPFRKLTGTTIEYDYNITETKKPIKFQKEEHFGICNGSNCMAYDGGICLLMEGNK